MCDVTTSTAIPEYLPHALEFRVFLVGAFCKKKCFSMTYSFTVASTDLTPKASLSEQTFSLSSIFFEA